MKIVSVPGHGDGPSVRALVVHGNDLCAEFYLPFAALLSARGVDVSLATLPGSHREPPLAEPTWPAFADEIVDAATRLEVDALIGHSMGGLMALLAAARLGARLPRLVLVEPAIYPPRWLGRVVARAYRKIVVDGQRASFSNNNGLMPRVHDLDRYPREMIDLYLEVRETSDAATARALFTSLPGIYPLPFADVAAETLLISGARTGVGGRLVAAMTRRALGGVTHHVLPGAAHWVFNERDDALVEHIAAFSGA
jgi:pimeloyl-ACP methyl ester carboxylesterase